MTDTLPLFPLGTVLLPGASLPLHIFEARYRQLMVDLISGDQRRFGVVGIKQGWEVGDDNVDSMHEVGCSVAMDRVRQLPAGRYEFTGHGEHRFRLLDVDREAAPYLMASVEWLPDTDPDPDSEAMRGKLASAARSAHERYHSTGVRGDNYDAPPEDIGIEQLAYTLADDCELTAEDRLALLAETDPLARLRLVRTVLLRETRFLRELRAIPAPLTEFAQTPGMN